DGRVELAFSIVNILIIVSGRILDGCGLAAFVVLDCGNRARRVDSRCVARGVLVGVGHAAGVVFTVDIGHPSLRVIGDKCVGAIGVRDRLQRVQLRRLRGVGGVCVRNRAVGAFYGEQVLAGRVVRVGAGLTGGSGRDGDPALGVVLERQSRAAGIRQL